MARVSIRGYAAWVLGADSISAAPIQKRSFNPRLRGMGIGGLPLPNPLSSVTSVSIRGYAAWGLEESLSTPPNTTPRRVSIRGYAAWVLGATQAVANEVSTVCVSIRGYAAWVLGEIF